MNHYYFRCPINSRVSVTRRDVEKLYPAVVWWDGRVKWDFPMIRQSSCRLDITYFPWDSQACELEFSSWTHSTAELILLNKTASGLIETEDGEWLIEDFPVNASVGYYPDPFSQLFYYLKLKRKPQYYIMNIVLPCVFITFCGMLVFLLPPDSGEKVSMSVTMLLSSTVFLLVVADILPQSELVPCIGKAT